MYAQQYRQPPKDYGGTAIKQQKREDEPQEQAPLSPQISARHGDELLLAVVILIVLSGGWEKNALALLSLFFILV
mgnify:CR=1 FL=1